MDNCYICLEKTSIYFNLKNCKCSIYCHDECFNKILKITPFSLKSDTIKTI